MPPFFYSERDGGTPAAVNVRAAGFSKRAGRMKSRRDGSCRHVLAVAAPLIMAQASATLMSFVDRIFLAKYSSTAMAGAMFAGIAGWTVISLFMGTTSYAGTFVAQYYGAGRHGRISVAVWHAVYLALISAALLFVVSCFTGPIMRFAGHTPEARAEEIIYFRIFVAGSGLMIMSGALSSFYGGLGRTWYNMAIHIPAHALNAILNYALIFGRFGLPRWGTKGAAVATVISSGVICLTFIILIRFGRLGREFAMLRRPRFEADIFRRLLRYGLPNGVQWTVDMVGWTAFVMLMFRLGEVAQQGSSIAFSINHLAFLPMIGFGIATSILVGQFVGRGETALAERATWNAFKMTFLYMALVATVFVVFGGPLVRLFKPEEVGENWPEAFRVGIIFLRFIAVYSLFDAGCIIYSAALKGAGDTRFVMMMIAVLSGLCLVLPMYLAVEVFKAGFYTAASIGTLYVGVLALAFYLRYKTGKWKSMRVIEDEAAPTPAADA